MDGTIRHHHVLYLPILACQRTHEQAECLHSLEVFCLNMRLQRCGHSMLQQRCSLKYHNTPLMLSRNGCAQRRCQRYRRPTAHRQSDHIPERYQGGPKECKQCTIEASSLQNLLINLHYHLEQGQTGDPWFTAVQTLDVKNGPLDQCKQALEQLQSKLDTGNCAKKMKSQLVWNFSKAEAVGILARIERLKSLVSIALEMDHL